ncbi:acyl-[acyl-carrier-protein] thioesterase [Desulfospira joergensenii]|uniref:acyl-[acyl-carrier-protein] thioesterase n=1 Tax=Desulfospira joergensenii TaxID=53329 RepID=UPI0003B57ADF|nr:acyl-ACP thioesterase domain-containing protein [Desulfospira joergensenii]
MESDTDLIHVREIELPYSAISATGQIKIDSLLNLFQDAASTHSRELGISGFDLAPKGLKWVVSRYQIRIIQGLPLSDPFLLKTWRRPWKNLYELRYFSVFDLTGKELVSALGIWILLKAKTSKPVRLTPHLPAELMSVPADTPDLWENDHDLDTYDYQTRFKIRYHDLDLNQHVNNSVYVKWAMEALPAPDIFDFSPCRLVISFVKESFYPDMIISKIKINSREKELTSFHSITHARDNSRLANLTVHWEKRPSHGPF